MKIIENYDEKINKWNKNQISRAKELFLILKQKKWEKLSVSDARFLIKQWYVEIVAKNLHKFEWLDNKIAESLIDLWYTHDIIVNLTTFKNLNKKTAWILIKHSPWNVAYGLSCFIDLDNKIAELLITEKYYDLVASNISRFQNLKLNTLLKLLINCSKYKNRLIEYRNIFEWWEPNKKVLNTLKKKWKMEEYKALKNFYDAIHFEEEKELFNENQFRYRQYGLSQVNDAIRYWRWNFVINNLQNYNWDYRQLVDSLIENRYLTSLKDHLWDLWWKSIDWENLVLQLACNDYYNELINNSENFNEEGINDLFIARTIIKNSSPDTWDCIKKLSDYSDDDINWDWINYTIEIYESLNKSKESFYDKINNFELDFKPVKKEFKLPRKLKEDIKNKYWMNELLGYINIFE